MDKLKGVNLGGWFVLEKWIKPSMFEGLDAEDETGFVLKHPNPQEALVEHWETFITAHDLKLIHDAGVNTVRLPVPWWMFGAAPYVPSVDHIKRAIKMIDEAGLDVIIDLHTAPGCQNGFDNGGIKGVIGWHTDPANITETIRILAKIVDTFDGMPSVVGYEVLNEPHMTVPEDTLKDFYLRAYGAIRKQSDKTVFFGDAFRTDAPFWEPFLTQSSFENIAFDLHPYHCFGDALPFAPFEKHLALALDRRLTQIKRISMFVPVIIGEWSLCMRYETMPKGETFDTGLYDRIIGNIQRYVYDHAWGQFFWTAKVEKPDDHHWDYLKLVEKGILAPFSK